MRCCRVCADGAELRKAIKAVAADCLCFGYRRVRVRVRVMVERQGAVQPEETSAALSRGEVAGEKARWSEASSWDTQAVARAQTLQRTMKPQLRLTATSMNTALVAKIAGLNALEAALLGKQRLCRQVFWSPSTRV